MPVPCLNVAYFTCSKQFYVYYQRKILCIDEHRMFNVYKSLLLFTKLRKRHRKYLNEQEHAQMNNVGGKVENLFASFSAELGNIIKIIIHRGISDHNKQF